MFVVVSYDIVDDKRRNKVANTLKNYGTRVQYSVFECLLKMEYLNRLIRDLRSIINESEDTVRIYNLCRSCVEKTRVYGKGKITEDHDVFIV